jgi:pimeloyl-ACP methyl ester carboxylesterase
MLDTITIGSLSLSSAQPRASGKAKPPILFIPGYFASAWAYECYLGFFAERGYAGFALNLRGRGGSALPNGAPLGCVSLNDFVDDGREAAEWLGKRFGPPIIFGHSMGGLIAQKLGEEDLASALVLICPAPPRGISVITGALLRRQLWYLPAIMRSKTVVPRWGDARELVLNRVPQAEQRTAFEQFVPDSGRAARELSFGSIAVNAERIRENNIPVLVVTSDDDRFIPPRIANRVAQRYHAPVYMARKHGHFVVREPGWAEPAGFIDGWIEREVLRNA